MRAATPQERAAIRHALPAFWRRPPASCVRFRIRVAGRFAEADPLIHPTKACSWASNGYYVLRRDGASWREIWEGSDAPACDLHIPKALAGTCMRAP